MRVSGQTSFKSKSLNSKLNNYHPSLEIIPNLLYEDRGVTGEHRGIKGEGSMGGGRREGKK